MQKLIPFIAVLLVASLGILYPMILPLCIVLSLLGIFYTLWQAKKRGFTPQSDTYKTIEKIKKQQVKKEQKKHLHINDQLSYIAETWGYTKEQEKTLEKFVAERAYGEMYNKLTGSLLPQVIALIDHCNAREQKGCKREVARRIRELTDLMKREFKKQKSQKVDTFETTLEVYDQLLKEIK